MNSGRSKPEIARPYSRRKMRVWVVILLLLLTGPMLVLARYGPGWAVAELVALGAWWLLVLLVKPTTWRRGPRWAYPFWVFVMSTLTFGYIALIVGLWLPPWGCLVIALSAGILITALIWPAQMRYHRLQRQLLEAEPSDVESDGPTSR